MREEDVEEKREERERRKKEATLSWEPVRSWKVSRKLFFRTAEHDTSPFNIPRIASDLFTGSIAQYRCTPTTSKSHCALSAPRPRLPGSAECSHFYGKLAVTFKIGVGVEEEIAYTAHSSSSLPLFRASFHPNGNEFANGNRPRDYARNRERPGTNYQIFLFGKTERTGKRIDAEIGFPADEFDTRGDRGNETPAERSN